jgi:hypothetical protein
MEPRNDFYLAQARRRQVNRRARPLPFPAWLAEVQVIAEAQLADLIAGGIVRQDDADAVELALRDSASDASAAFLPLVRAAAEPSDAASAVVGLVRRRAEQRQADERAAAAPSGTPDWAAWA